MIGLIDLLKANGVAVDTDSVKIHLACWSGSENPIDVYYAGDFDEWQAWQTKRNFSCEQVISLIDLGQNSWLFVGIYEILDCQVHPQNKDHYRYSMKLPPMQDDLVGRVVVQHKRSGRASYIWYKTEIALSILEVRREKLTIEEFPGYNSVILNYARLKIITEQKIASWYGALANIKGVYLITDSSTGKQYVGSATGGDGIWQRWCNYANSGHGGNVELKKLLKAEGKNHVRHFQYSILEIADTHASDNDILIREQHWMDVLKTRDFGLN